VFHMFFLVKYCKSLEEGEQLVLRERYRLSGSQLRSCSLPGCSWTGCESTSKPAAELPAAGCNGSSNMQQQ
jgi:hypothetical protein